VADAVGEIRTEHWDKRKDAWVVDRSGGREVRRSRRPLTDVRWVVSVEPAGVFNWKNVREELARRGRPIIDERQASLDVPAIDELDALLLCEELEGLNSVKRVARRPLGWFERWRRREQVLGNYSSDSGAYFGL
jgi:hypothetical protein